MELQIYVDANSTEDGKARYGCIIQNGAITLAQGSGFYSGGFSSTPAEHIACDIAYRIVKIMARRLKEKVEKITLFTDSEIFIKESYRRPMSLKAMFYNGGLSEGYRIPIEYKWIPSEENKAHRLVRDGQRSN